MRGKFEGWYFKHQCGENMLAVIPGRAADGAFVQVITENGSCRVDYPLESYDKKETLHIGDSMFSDRGIRLAIDDKGISLHGTLDYNKLTHINGDIMGPFKYFPMECSHSVVSMNHELSGSVVYNGKTLKFNGGRGYIEGDSGASFPSDYAWVHCNDFGENCSIMASAARIPFCGLHFWGCICVVMLEGREHRLATYRGARIKRCAPGGLVLEQGDYQLEVTVDADKGHELSAPRSGAMSRVIRESVSCPAQFRFICKNNLLFEGRSNRASYEYALNMN